MNEIDIASTVDSVLGILAERFGSTVEHLWTLMIRQAYVEGIAMLLLNILLIIVTVYAVKWFRYAAYDLTGYSNNKWRDHNIVIAIGIVIVLCIWWAISLGSFSSLLTALINPEVYALKEIFSMLSGS